MLTAAATIEGLARVSAFQNVHLTFFPCYFWRGGLDHGTIIYGEEVRAA